MTTRSLWPCAERPVHCLAYAEPLLGQGESLTYASAGRAAALFFLLPPSGEGAGAEGLLHVHAAVDVDLGAGDVAALGDEEAGDGGDFFGLAEAAEGDLGQERRFHLVG